MFSPLASGKPKICQDLKKLVIPLATLITEPGGSHTFKYCITHCLRNRCSSSGGG